MKKNILTLAVLGAVLLGSSYFAQKALADGMPYEPVFETMPINESITTASTNPVSTTKSTITKVTPVATPEKHAVNLTNPSVEGDNLQNALMQLDSAQVEIRNQLIQYKSEYTDVDNQYKLIKEQRKLKGKLVKETEKRIKNLDNTKAKIRKSM